MSPVWLIPAVVFFLGAIALFDARRRLDDETRRLAKQMVTVRADVSELTHLRTETQAFAAAVRSTTRR